MKKFSRIFLVGFRATGKSTLGKLLADKLGWSFMDLDFLITQQEGEDVGKITKNGTDWRRFREIENEALKEMSVLKNVVISCGGGVGVNDIPGYESGKTYGDLNAQIFKNSNNSLVVLLKTDEKIIEERLRVQYKNKKLMPFLSATEAKNSEGLDLDDLIEKLVKDSMQALKKREPLYEKLTEIKIDTSGKTNEKIAQEVLNYVR
ncbi:AAA family ATPase [Candidatus Daviesbacteria bacterium]|nr:AAA family ATPase [Candidatus Daviesbacteria bacterium]